MLPIQVYFVYVCGGNAMLFPQACWWLRNYQKINHRADFVGKSGKQAFTLVELLVVIAIISILASLLLPTLQRTMQQSNLAACSSNQRQSLVAIAIYQGDYNSLPDPRSHPAYNKNSTTDWDFSGWDGVARSGATMVWAPLVDPDSFDTNRALICSTSYADANNISYLMSTYASENHLGSWDSVYFNSSKYSDNAKKTAAMIQPYYMPYLPAMRARSLSVEHRCRANA